MRTTRKRSYFPALRMCYFKLIGVIRTARPRHLLRLLIGVGIVIAHDPLHGPGRALISASGSYLR
jgi:hypothetical protein